MSSSSLKPSMQMGQVREDFFMMRVLTRLTLVRWQGLGPRQGSKAIYDISNTELQQSTNYFLYFQTPTIHFQQNILTNSDAKQPPIYSPNSSILPKKQKSMTIIYDQSVLIFSQRMNKKQIILENPFHPLDLSPHDLLAIYKRFQQSRQINRNPKQQLPIEVISQLISSLKGCPPSYVQKCISQALIKETISWNQFLTFLDQQSEVRQKILQWLMYQKSVIKYREEREWPLRQKLNTFFQEITFLTFIQLSQSQKFLLCSIDNNQFYLLEEVNKKLHIIDQYRNRSERTNDQRSARVEQQTFISTKDQSKIFKNQSRVRRPSFIAKSIHKSDKKQAQKNIQSILSSANKLSSTTYKDEEDQQFYFKKQRKNINSLFNIWKDLNLQHSVNYAKAVAPKLSDKNINATQIQQIRQVYSGINDEKVHDRKVNHGGLGGKPLDKAKTLLKDLHRQKRTLSYNPYAAFRSTQASQTQVKFRKPIIKQRKTRQYTHQSNKQVYNSQLRCLAVIYFNMEIVLVKLIKEFNKVSLQQQDKIKVITQSQHKKNQIIQAVDFYHHSIVNKWFLIVLIRIQYKNQLRNQNQSYIRGYHVEMVGNKRKGGDQGCRFASKKQAFIFHLGTKNQVFKMEMQPEYGIHFITVGGKYICIKQDYIEKEVSCQKSLRQTVLQTRNQQFYFCFSYEQRFKNAGVSLSCLSIGVELNKIVFGTIRGMIIIYDMFSHFFKIKKITNCQITQIKVISSLAYLLTLDEKLIVMDLVKMQQVQCLSVKNDSKLHQKVKRFQMSKNIIYFYGTQMRSYSQFINQSLQHQRRKMQTIYKWRLDKLFKNQSSFAKDSKYQVQVADNYMPKNAIQTINSANVEIVIDSESYILILTDILELIVVDRLTMKIKFTMVLAIPHDSKVMKMALGPKEKLLALLLFNQNIYVFNIHTQDQYQVIKPTPFYKFTSISFLDLKNEYMLANGTQSGKILLSPYNSIPEKRNKILQFHTKTITSLTVIKKECLISCSEDYLISIWVLPFNVLKHDIRINRDIGFVIGQAGVCKQFIYLRTLEGTIIEVNSHEGKIVRVIKEVMHWNCAKIDPCPGNPLLFGTTKNNTLQKMIKGPNGWTKAGEYKIDVQKSEVKELGIIESEKVLVFLLNGAVMSWSYQTQKFCKSMTLYHD